MAKSGKTSAVVGGGGGLKGMKSKGSVKTLMGNAPAKNQNYSLRGGK